MLRGGTAALMLFRLCHRGPSPGVVSVLLLAAVRRDKGEY